MLPPREGLQPSAAHCVKPGPQGHAQLKIKNGLFVTFWGWLAYNLSIL